MPTTSTTSPKRIPSSTNTTGSNAPTGRLHNSCKAAALAARHCRLTALLKENETGTQVVLPCEMLKRDILLIPAEQAHAPRPAVQHGTNANAPVGRRPRRPHLPPTGSACDERNHRANSAFFPPCPDPAVNRSTRHAEIRATPHRAPRIATPAATQNPIVAPASRLQLLHSHRLGRTRECRPALQIRPMANQLRRIQAKVPLAA